MEAAGQHSATAVRQPRQRSRGNSSNNGGGSGGAATMAAAAAVGLLPAVNCTSARQARGIQCACTQRAGGHWFERESAPDVNHSKMARRPDPKGVEPQPSSAERPRNGDRQGHDDMWSRDASLRKQEITHRPRSASSTSL